MGKSKPKPKPKPRTSNPPSQREIGRGDPSNRPSQRDIGGGETSNPPPPQEEIGGGKEIVIIDTDLLDCSICTYPLCPPIHQCTNGHVACHTCWSKLKDKCHICSLPVLSRNIALEKVLESVHLPCTYANLGCPKSVSYSQRQVHTDTCEFVPSSCPMPSCAHKAFSGKWRGHFMKDHWETSQDYSYGQSIDILFDAVMVDLEEDLYYTLHGPNKDLFLFVKEPILNVGNALSLYYIDLPHDQEQNMLSFELTVFGRYNTITLQLKSPVISIKEWKRGEVGGSSLLVPLGFPAFQNALQIMKLSVLFLSKDVLCLSSALALNGGLCCDMLLAMKLSKFEF
ncbi:putative E3 ubiquitin-protein ligase SINA-like 9 isoform X1 [Carex littledalei]|uniref:RING-type E3 ubiquitin transferase n=1 Tax=Carex littledalei TaxID=544730 RepID=A0A833QG56_9POAL|nr:putative E3 ubiquitin-protein ligase SINA-like 9 isoform X1 [Carex littledalei]